MPEVTPAPAGSRVSVRAIVPSVLGWDTFARAYATLLLFLVAAFGGEWVVHQSVYHLVYGSRFGAVMANDPHRYYMTPLGLLYGLAGVGFLMAVAGVLYLYAARRQHLLAVLPARFRRSAPPVRCRLAPATIASTALALTVLQSLIYVVQENLEWAAQTGAFPGPAVVSPAVHPAVLPLQLAVAACISVILWMLSACVTASSESLQAAQILTGLAAAPASWRLGPVPLVLVACGGPRFSSCRPRAPPRAA